MAGLYGVAGQYSRFVQDHRLVNRLITLEVSIMDDLVTNTSSFRLVSVGRLLTLTGGLGGRDIQTQ